MAKCEDCHREMGLAASCIELPMIIARRDYVRLRHPASETRRCYDCNVKPDGVHHGGREEERCPRCGRQLIMCPCRGKRFRSLHARVEANRV